MSTALPRIGARIRRGAPLAERIRFYSKVDENGCWRWQSSKAKDGYGRIGIRDGGRTRYRPTHRVAYEVWRGTPPAGLELDHLCRVRDCVNPDHLEPVTHHENMRRGAQARKTTCKNGHPFDAANTLRRPRPEGGRACRTCRNRVRHETKRRAASRALLERVGGEAK